MAVGGELAVILFNKKGENMKLGIKLNLSTFRTATISDDFSINFAEISNLQNWNDDITVSADVVSELEMYYHDGERYLGVDTTNPVHQPEDEFYDDDIDRPSLSTYISFNCIVSDNDLSTLLKLINLGIVELDQFGKTNMIVYRLNDERHKLNKNLTPVTILEGKFTAPLGIKSLELDVVNYDIDNSYNYVYIPRLKRYYYVTNIQLTTKDYTKLILQEDVLMSWSSLIKEQSAYVTRYSGASNSLLVDERYPVKDEAEVDYFIPSMTTGVNVVSFKYVMDVVGGKAKPNILCKTSSEIITFLTDTTNVSAPTGSGLPNIEGTKSKLNKVYLLNIDDYSGIVRASLLNDAPTTFIHSVMLVPFDLADVIPSATLRNSNLLAGNKWLAVTGGTHWTDTSDVTDPVFPETSMNAIPYIVVADFTFDAIGNITRTYNYLDYAPNTLWEIYIPFVGWIPLDPVQVLGKRIMIYFSMDIDTGLSTCYIYNRTDQKIIWSGSCQLGMKLSLAVTNADELARQKQATSLNLIMGLVSSMVSMGIGGVSGNPIAMVGGIMGGANTIANAVNSFRSMIDKAQITFGSSDNALFSPNSIIVRKTTHKKLITTVDEEKNYKALNGYPYKQYVALSSLTTDNYVEIGNIHFDARSENIYQVEIEEIIALLKNGVIM